MEQSVLFLGKKGDRHCEAALNFLRMNFRHTTAKLGEWGDRLGDDVLSWEGDYIVSYLSRWVVPDRLLSRSRIHSINFHPAPPDYPGVGCTNFALYEGAEEYGVTCHFMNPAVDTGDIIATRKFPIFLSDTVSSLLSRTYDFQLSLFYEVIAAVLNGKELVASGERWSRRPFSRTELNELSRLSPDMSPEEIARRVRSTSFGAWQPTLELAGFTFELKPSSR